MYTVGGSAKWCSHCGKHGGVSKKLNIELPYDPAIPLLDIFFKNTESRVSKTPMFIQHDSQ